MPAIKKHLIFLLFCTLLYGACKEKDCHKDGSCAEDYRRLRLSDEAKSYLWADTGSWWIYKNTKTGELDTQTVIYFKFDSVKVRGQYDYSQHITLEYDVLQRNIYSTYNEWTYRDKTTSFDPDYNLDSYVFFGLDRYVSAQGTISPFHSPFDPSISSGTGSSNTKFLGVDTIVLLRGKIYNTVVRFEIDRDDIWEEKLGCIRSNNIYYWARGVGLISKHSNTCNFSWELVDCHIVK